MSSDGVYGDRGTAEGVRAMTTGSSWIGRGWLCLALGIATAGPVGAESPRAARWVGPEAMAYVEVERPNVLIDRVTSEPFQTLLASIPPYQRALKTPGYKQFREILG